MKTSMIVSALLTISTIIFAQTQERPHRNGGGRLEKLKSELSLNDAQYASIKDINERYADQFSQLRKDSTTDRNERRTAITALHNKRQREINDVLTPEQKTKLENIRKERTEKRRAVMKARGERHHAQMVKELSLTDEQSAKVADANKTFIEKIKALREKSVNSKGTRREEIKKLRTEHQAALQSIMTPEQFNNWKEMRKSMKENHKKNRSRKK